MNELRMLLETRLRTLYYKKVYENNSPSETEKKGIVEYFENDLRRMSNKELLDIYEVMVKDNK